MEGDLKMISVIEVQKELFKSKVMAKFSHYTSGSLYYTVELESGKYQFPISIIDIVTLKMLAKEILFIDGEKDDEYQPIVYDKIYKHSEIKIAKEENREPIEMMFIQLSEDLGTTTFSNEMKGSELNRWIKKSIENEEFIKVG